MKTTLKTLLAGAIASFLFITAAKAQTTTSTSPWRLGFGLEGGVTTSGFAAKPEFGATARLQYSFSKTFAATFTSGYYDFVGNQTFASMGMIPVKLGLKAFVGSGLYFDAEAGAGFQLHSFNSYANQDTGVPKTTKLILSPGFGYAHKAWDVSLRYESFSGNNTKDYSTSDAGMIGLRLAYSFGL